jgi:Tol biopolymer transport system component
MAFTLVVRHDAATLRLVSAEDLGSRRDRPERMGTMVLRRGAWCVLMVLGVVATAGAQNTTTRVSVSAAGAQGNGSSDGAAVSADGRFVAFESIVSFAPDDTNGERDIYIRDRVNGTTQRVSLGSSVVQAVGGPSVEPAISSDGRFVAFTSWATNLVLDDTNGFRDIFIRDRGIPTTFRVSVGFDGKPANDYSVHPSISADGRYVVFESYATNIVAGDTNNSPDIFLHDRKTLTTVRVSVATGGAQAAGPSVTPRISADGRTVVFKSDAANLVPGDTNKLADIFARDLDTGTTTRVSVGTGGVQSNGYNNHPVVSGDGRFVAFYADGSNFQAGAGKGTYVHDRQTGVTSALFAIASGGNLPVGTPAAISSDGQQVCVVGVDKPGIIEATLINRQTLAKTRVSVSTSGDAANIDIADCSLNADGTIVGYSTAATNLVPSDTNQARDVFVRTAFAAMASDKTALRFGVAMSGAAIVAQTSPQTVRLTQSGVGTVTWQAFSSQPWLKVTPFSGSGSATLTVTVVAAAGLPVSGTVTGEVVVLLGGAVNTLPPIGVALTVTPSGITLGPVGTVDTPTDNRTGVTGALPFTGWALDDVEVTRVSICRAAFGAEVAPVDPNCGNAAEIFVGFAVFIDGARPDVASSFPAYPLATRAGWGFMVLTNMLPNQGNGTYQFTMRAQDREGNWSLLGRRTMTCANASSTLPFGTLDTPFQGGTASGTSYVNFGWALTPLPKTIPTNGSTIHVLVDGVDVGTADYNHARPDIQAVFPGFNNTNGAVGFRILDTTLWENGIHTISWTVTDDQGAIEGLGSRFFTVSNGASAVTAAAMSAGAPIDVDDAPRDVTPLVGRRGWDLEASYGSFAANANGISVIRSEEVNRVELQLGDGEYTGYLRTSAGLAPLPIGSRLDRATNTFTWAPGVGFVGRYDFVFVRSADGRVVSRREVRIILHPKGRGAVGPQVVIDTPRANAVVREPFMIGGWAVDLDAAEGTGVTTLHAWAFPAAGGAPIFLGATAYGGARPDVAAVHGDRFKQSGFGLIVQSLPVGDYDLALFAWSSESLGFVAPARVRVHVTP